MWQFGIPSWGGCRVVGYNGTVLRYDRVALTLGRHSIRPHNQNIEPFVFSCFVSFVFYGVGVSLRCLFVVVFLKPISCADTANSIFVLTTVSLKIRTPHLQGDCNPAVSCIVLQKLAWKDLFCSRKSILLQSSLNSWKD
jgi:hypothetical protein